MSPVVKDIVHNFVVPVFLGLALTVFKIMSELKDLENNEWSGIALDMVLVSIGSFAFYMRGRDIDAIISAGAGNVVVAAILLFWRYIRAKKAAKLNQPVPQIQWYWAFVQLVLGIGAFVWTIKAF